MGREQHNPGQRLAVAHLLDNRVLLPVDAERTPALQRADELLKAGYGLVVAIPHFSYGDFMRVASALFEQSKEIRGRHLVIPIAEHQRHFPGMNTLASFTQTELRAVVTADTKAREALRLAQGKRIPWEVHDEGFGTAEYIGRAVETLNSAGVVLFAPQAGRRSVLNPFERRVFQVLDVGMRRKKAGNKVAYLFAGIEIPGVDDYSKSQGYNRGKRYKVSFDVVLKAEEFAQRAHDNGRTLDEEAYAIMLDLAPTAYKPQQTTVFEESR